MLYSIVGILVIILDQAVKFWVSDTLFGSDVVRFIPGVVSLVNVHNDGAAFSFLSGQGARIYFIVATGIFTLLVVIALATNFIRGRFSRWCLVFVAAGGLGNMIDRIIYGYVQDMFKVELFNFAIFNVADIFITVFALLFALSMIFERPESDKIDVLYEDDEDEKPSREERKAAKAAAKAEAKAAKAEAKAAKKAAKKGALPEADAEVPAPQEAGSVRSARKARQDRDEQEYAAYRAQQRAAAAKPAPAPAAEAQTELPTFTPVKPETTAPASGTDPFAAWEIANARAEASQANGYAGRLMDAPAPAAKPAAKPVSRPAPAPVQPEAPAAPAPRASRAKAAPARPAARPVSKPAPAPKAEAPKPAPKPEPAPVETEEFSLDDILAEFK